MSSPSSDIGRHCLIHSNRRRIRLLRHFHLFSGVTSYLVSQLLQFVCSSPYLREPSQFYIETSTDWRGNIEGFCIKFFFIYMKSLNIAYDLATTKIFLKVRILFFFILLLYIIVLFLICLYLYKHPPWEGTGRVQST